MACGATNQQAIDDASTSIAIEEDSDLDADSDEPDEPLAKPSSSWESDNNPNPEIGWYTTARLFVLRNRVSCAFLTRCTCVEFKLRMKRESKYFETHECSLAAL